MSEWEASPGTFEVHSHPLPALLSNSMHRMPVLIRKIKKVISVSIVGNLLSFQ